MLVVVAEQREVARVLAVPLAVLLDALEARDPLIDQLRCRGVVADHDEDRWYIDPRRAPRVEHLGVVVVERVQRGRESGGDRERIKIAGFRGALLGHVLAYVLPQVAVD